MVDEEKIKSIVIDIKNQWDIIQNREYDYDRIDTAVRNLDILISELVEELELLKKHQQDAFEISECYYDRYSREDVIKES